ncbi:MAG: DUF4864 domain-containing protein [Chloroflexi bacterium]|nr:DUF4864 domain-containing protein [Chloroflexota bacterium]
MDAEGTAPSTPIGEVPASPPRSGRNRLLLLGGGCLAVLLCLGCVGAFVLAGGLAAVGFGNLFGPADAVANEFMSALRDSDWQRAYALLDPRLQREVGTVAQFQQLIVRGRAQPQSWNWTRRNIDNDQATWGGSTTFTSGRRGTVELQLTRSSNTWRLIAFDLQPE